MTTRPAGATTGATAGATAARIAPPLLLAALAYGPPLLTAPGMVAADTKQYLLLDPGRLLATAASVWDPAQFGGHVTHQQAGYLWPMGPWFRLGAALGLPDWVTQRLWLGTLFLAAGLGLRWLARHLGLAPAGALVAGAAYQLSPYVLSYANRTSGLLLPWAALPTLIMATRLAVRHGGWRWPAVAGLVAGTAGGLNATALVLVLPGPALWLALDGAARWRAERRRVLAATARLALCGAVTALWWAVPLALAGRYGADVLAYSETLGAVSTTASGPEVLRGLGYWLTYGATVDGPWNSAAPPYLTGPVVLTLGFVLAATGLAGLVAWRGPARRGLVLSVAAGAALATLAFAPGAASPLGRFLIGLGERSTPVLALRSATRAVPLVVLGLAAGLGLVVDAMTRRARASARWPVTLAAVAVLAANLPTAFTGGLVDDDLRRPSSVPAWWTQAAAALDGRSGAGRVLELPGQEFAAYRWGTTTDPLLPGLTSRPLLLRDLLPLGAPETMDLLLALDDRLQQGRFEPAGLVPVARLLGVGDVVARLDAADERYRTPRPTDVVAAVDAAAGLGPLQAYGPLEPSVAEPVRVDGRGLVDADGPAPTPRVAVWPVDGPVDATRTVGADATVLVAGSGDGVVDAAVAGLIDGTEALRYAASLGADEAIAAATPLVLTDANRRRARQWRGTQDTVGLTETVTPSPYEPDEADARLPLFPAAGPGDETVTVQRGATVAATGYGEPNAYRPEDRAVFAFDGDPTTAWRVADRGDPVGQRLRVDLPSPTTIEHVRLVQPQRPANRWITEVVVRTATGTRRVPLEDASLGVGGQDVIVGGGATSWLELEVTATSTGPTPSGFGLDAVGFAEVDVGVAVDEIVQLPTAIVDRLAAAGGGGAAAGAATARPVAVVLTRERVDPAERWRADPEPTLTRSFRLPAAQDAPLLTVEARLHARADEATLRALLGPADAPVVRTSSRLVGMPAASGAAALDGDEGTAWTGAVDDAAGAWWEAEAATARAVGRVEVQVVAGALRSAPRRLAVSVDGGAPVLADVGADGRAIADLGGVVGRTVRVAVVDAELRTGIDRRVGETLVLPVSFAEVRIGAEAPTPWPERVDTGCRTDLLTLDGRPFPVRLTGRPVALLAGEPVMLDPCAPTGPLAAGDHELRTAPGARTGIDIDRVVLRHRWPADASAGAPVDRSVGVVAVSGRTRTRAVLAVPASDQERWLVFGEGRNDGWRAMADGVDLGIPTALVGGGNAWRLPASGPLTVTVDWRPQRWADAGFAVSGLGALVGLALVAWPRRRSPAATTVTSFGTASFGTGAFGPSGSGDVAPGPGTAIGLAVATALVVHPVYALALLAAWGWWRRGSALAGSVVGLAGPALALSVGAYVVLRQVVSRPVAGFGWPLAFDAAHRPALAAVAVVVLAGLGRPPVADAHPPAEGHEGAGGGDGGERHEG